MSSFFEVLALIYLIIFLPIPIVGIIAHSAINFWRRLGMFSYFIFVLFWFFFGVIIVYYKEKILEVQFSSNVFLIALGVVLVVIAFYVDSMRSKVFDLKKLIGFSEVMPNRFKQELVTVGIYSKIRHPRYLAFMLLSCGAAFITGFYYAYLAAVYMIVGLFILIFIEERELRNRFGKSYVNYCKRVPMLVPQVWRLK